MFAYLWPAKSQSEYHRNVFLFGLHFPDSFKILYDFLGWKVLLELSNSTSCHWLGVYRPWEKCACYFSIWYTICPRFTCGETESQKECGAVAQVTELIM